VGVYESVEADTLDFDVLSGDSFLICSDGLSNYLEHSTIQETFEKHPADEVAQRFVDLANAAGGRDNITALVVSVPDLITVLDLETGEPVTTEGLRYGFRVAVLAIPSPPQWRGEAGLRLVGPRYFGYDVDYTPVEQRLGAA
jgi:hypothetical protein